MRIQWITLALALWALSTQVVAQATQNVNNGEINKRVAVQSGQEIKMHFDYPELISVTTWEGNEVVITGTVNINDNEHNDAFYIDETATDKYIKVSAGIKGLKDLPQRVTVWDGEQKITFKDRDEMKNFERQHGKKFNTTSVGADINIKIQVKIPKGFTTHIESVYGVIEVKNFEGPLSAEATYGAVDVALKENAVGEIIAETNYGEIFTDLSASFIGDVTDEMFYTHVIAKPGSGPTYSLESRYGNVYIRKQ